MSTAAERHRAAGLKGVATQKRYAAARNRMLLVMLAALDDFTMPEAKFADVASNWSRVDFARIYDVPFYALRVSSSSLENYVRKLLAEGLLERRMICSARTNGRAMWLYSWVE